MGASSAVISRPPWTEIHRLGWISMRRACESLGCSFSTLKREIRQRGIKMILTRCGDFMESGDFESLSEGIQKERFPNLSIIKLMPREKLAWLAGIMDGEGTIIVTRSRDQKAKTGFNYAPHFEVGNTDRKMIDAVRKILEALGIQTRSNGQWTKGKNPKWFYRTQVHNNKDILMACKSVLPFLVTKRKNARIVARFCEQRLQHRWEAGFVGRIGETARRLTKSV